MQLTQKQVSLSQVMPPPQQIPFVKPLTYEFRVAEHLDDEGKISRVALQVQVWEHDEYGSGIVKQYWQDVPRCKFNKDGTAIIT